MIIGELFQLFSWLSFSSSHCDVLEERSNSIVETMRALKEQQNEDERLFQRERVCVHEAHANLDGLEVQAKAIQEVVEKALPEMKEQAASYEKQIERMQNVAAALFVPDAVLEKEQQILISLTATQESIQRIQEGVQKL